jgi:hypothetical protein
MGYASSLIERFGVDSASAHPSRSYAAVASATPHLKSGALCPMDGKVSLA